jgi:hypothetical protein
MGKFGGPMFVPMGGGLTSSEMVDELTKVALQVPADYHYISGQLVAYMRARANESHLFAGAYDVTDRYYFLKEIFELMRKQDKPALNNKLSENIIAALKGKKSQRAYDLLVKLRNQVNDATVAEEKVPDGLVMLAKSLPDNLKFFAAQLVDYLNVRKEKKPFFSRNSQVNERSDYIYRVFNELRNDREGQAVARLLDEKEIKRFKGVTSQNLYNILVSLRSTLKLPKVAAISLSAK